MAYRKTDIYLKIMIDGVRIKIHCDGCNSSSIISHEMEEVYAIHNCPFCGKDIDQELECEELFEDDLS